MPGNSLNHGIDVVHRRTLEGEAARRCKRLLLYSSVRYCYYYYFSTFLNWLPLFSAVLNKIIHFLDRYLCNRVRKKKKKKKTTEKNTFASVGGPSGVVISRTCAGDKKTRQTRPFRRGPPGLLPPPAGPLWPLMQSLEKPGGTGGRFSVTYRPRQSRLPSADDDATVAVGA